MPPSADALRLPVHPHQLEVQEFGSYALILDLRSAKDFAQDHVPGAVNLPWAGSGDAALLTGSARRALSAAEGDPAPTYPLRALVADLRPGDAVLVYCGQGGVQAQAVAEVLRPLGFHADVLPGGHTNYRRWVDFGLDLLPRTLSLRWVRSPPAGGSQQVLEVLAGQSEQTVSLAALLGQKLLPGLTLVGEGSTTQAQFESDLVGALRTMDPGRPVWVDEVLMLGPGPVLPMSLTGELRRCPVLRVGLPLDERVRLWGESLVENRLAFDELIDALFASIPPSERPAALRKPVESNSSEALLPDIIDPMYARLAVPSPDQGGSEVVVRSCAGDVVLSGVRALPASTGIRLGQPSGSRWF